MFDLFFREDKGDQILDYKQEIQTMEEQLKKLQKEVQKGWLMLLDSSAGEEEKSSLWVHRKTLNFTSLAAALTGCISGWKTLEHSQELKTQVAFNSQ